MNQNPDQHETQQLTIDDFDWSHVDIARRAMMSMLKQIILCESRHEDLPLPDSQAARETILVPEIEKAYHRAGTLMMNAIDHAYALNAVLETRKISLAPWTCGRVILETCTLASWLLDGDIVCRERLLRCIKLRIRDIRGQQLHYEMNKDRIKMSNLAVIFEREQSELKSEQTQLRNMALELKLPLDESAFKANRFANLGRTVKATDLVPQYFDTDLEWFQLLSGIAHSNEWAMEGQGMRSDRLGGLGVVRVISPSHAIHLLQKCSEWIGKTNLRRSKVLGMNTDEFQAILDANYPVAWVH